ncbi:MAG: hypothetical protein VX899_19180 [Myxococcota bacterium]|nr:hypothetical protein [Myxococcota bacterium]
MLLALIGAALAADPADAGWTLVGVYDATAVTGMVPDTAADYAWQAASGMTKSCGPAKRPDGLGVFEATAVANRLTPTLAIVLENTAGSEAPLRDDQLSVGLGYGEYAPVKLQPAVMPRYMAALVEGGEERYQQLVRTQLAMELCMEHKTGRGWTGGSGPDLRQAFLLDDRSESAKVPRDRKFFAGQGHPVPALVGPPDACFVPSTPEEVNGWRKLTGEGSGKGESSLGLVPADVWGAGLRICPPERAIGDDVRGFHKLIPLRLSSELPWDAPTPLKATWNILRVTIGEGELDEEIGLEVNYGEENLFSGKLYDPIEPGPDADANLGQEYGLKDVLAMVPHTYPQVGPRGDSSRYTVLLIPNWQLVEAIRRIEDAEKAENQGHEQEILATSMRTTLDGTFDGVGWVMDHPEALFIQVAPQGAAAGEDAAWPNLSTSLAGHDGQTRAWGYTTGLLSGRKPIALVSPDAPTFMQASMGQRAPHQGVFMAAITGLFILLVGGLLRLNHLWARLPEERVAYWPGKDAGKEADGEGAEGMEAPPAE